MKQFANCFEGQEWEERERERRTGFGSRDMEEKRGDCGSSFVKDLLARYPALFGDLLANAPRFRFQVLLSQPLQPPHGRPTLVRHGYRVDDEYFYPASAIKMCAAVTAIEKLKHLESLLGISVNCITPVALYSLFEGVEDDRSDPSNLNKKQITVAHEIRKIFLVSDNKAFNRLFSLVGHRTINQAMWDLGLQSTRLHHRLSETRLAGGNLYSEPIDLNVGGIAFTLPPKHSGLIVQDNNGLPGVKVGTAYIADDDHMVLEPMDFSKKNYMSMVDLQNLLIMLVRPDMEVGTPGLKLDAAMRMLLMEAMAQFPSESANPKYEASAYPDDYCKFFLPGVSRIRPKGALRIYNKIGRAYGFTIDNSYVFDVETGRSFFLTAVIYTNANGVLNDDRYEYEYADRILADLAEVLARALWQIPDSSATLSRPFDCTPSSLWAICSKPLTNPSCTEGNVNTEEAEESKSPSEEKIHYVEQHLTELTLTSSAEKHSLSLSLQQSHVQRVCQQISSNLIGLKEGSPCGTLPKQSNSGCYSVLQPSSAKSVRIDTTRGDYDRNPADDVPPLLATQFSGYKLVSTPCANKIFNNIKPCYKYFVDE